MISRQTIDAVFDAARVEEVIGDFVQLKKSGSNFKGLSPFTDERTPSFMVSPVKQIWKDFSSGKGGNVVSFVMEHEHFSYPEAIRYLARKYGIEIEETQQTDEQKEEASEKESLYLISEFARDYFHRVLLEEEEGKAIGGTYFKERGFTADTIEKFALGYSPQQWDAFTLAAKEKGYQIDLLEKTGLTIVREDKQFDRFKGRVMFPIRSMSGRVLGFGGRILSSEKKAAKYLNSPESPIYQKSKVLYGIYQAKQAIAKQDNCYLVEGYTDVIQMNQRGLEHVVASSGTALTVEQIRLVRRLTNNITLLFDGDAAGIRASLRGVDLILEQGMNVRICTFPEGEDPDSFARNNTLDQLQDYLSANTQDFIRFKTSLLLQDSGNDPHKRGQTIRDIVQSISKVPDAIQREVYIQECARLMDISEEVLFNSLAQQLEKSRRDAKKDRSRQEVTQPMEVIADRTPVTAKVDGLFELERKLIELLLLYGHKQEEFEDLVLESDAEGEISFRPDIVEAKVYEKIYLDLQEDEIEFTNLGFRKLYSHIIDSLNQDQEIQTEVFVSRLPQELAILASDLLMEEEKHKLHAWQRKEIFVRDKDHQIGQVVSETILNLRRHLVSLKIDELSTEIKESDDENQKQSNMQDIIDYIMLKKVLSEKLNRVV
ncbi:DNA primase [Aureitalea marina]|uniref:DNA primase n=1 Tax=Aureitalea marina TaxID=930804 RepID=A0A2S7KM55_9FLAO|nr:DNA primase [Aureitalea marina]PQB03670.1 DNA primase [Aureitalea marina]